MKKRFFALLAVTVLIATGCSSSSDKAVDESVCGTEDGFCIG
jgi:uncharacterized protein YcfL